MKKLSCLLLGILMIFCCLSLTAYNHTQHIHAVSWSCPEHGSAYVQYSYNPGINCTSNNVYAFYCTYVDGAGIPCIHVEEIADGVGPHSWTKIDTNLLNPTCTTAGHHDEYCPICNNFRTVTDNALGHNYRTTSKTEVSCTTDGKEEQNCNRCGFTRTVTTAALGHDFKEETIEATCKEEGKITKTCSRCTIVEEEVLPKLEHIFDEKEKVEPTCEQAGYVLSYCELCQDEIKEELAALGHKFPEQWKIEKEPGLFTKGEKSKTCSECTTKVVEMIDPKISTTAILITGASTVVAIGLGVWLFKANKIKRKLKMATELKEISDKTLVMNIIGEENRFKDLFKSKAYLKVIVADDETFAKESSDNEADLSIIEIGEGRTLEQAIELIDATVEEYEDASFAIICSQFADLDLVNQLEALKGEDKINCYILADEKDSNVLIKMILPLYKPEFTIDDGIENLGDLCDAIGIPYVSTVTNLYLTGKDIKENLEADEKGYDEISTIVADVASILGIEAVETVKDMIDSTITVKEAFDKEHGANETKEGVKAASDIVETIKDIV